MISPPMRLMSATKGPPLVGLARWIALGQNVFPPRLPGTH